MHALTQGGSKPARVSLTRSAAGCKKAIQPPFFLNKGYVDTAAMQRLHPVWSHCVVDEHDDDVGVGSDDNDIDHGDDR